MITDQRLNSLFWAATLSLSGILLLLFNFRVFVNYEPVFQYVVGSVLGIGALTFFVAFASNRSHWWRLIPGWTLLALAVMVFLTIRPEQNQRLTAALLFVGLALAFANIYLLNRDEHWWSIIPGGFMLVLGFVIGLSSWTERAETLGAVLFTGMGLVFFMLYALGGRRRQWWALIPGNVLILFGLFIFVLDRGGENRLVRWWPAVLVLAGVFMGWRAYVYRPSPRNMSVNTAPGLPRTSSRTVSGSVQRRSSQQPRASAPGKLGDYVGPAPGASVEVLPDPDE